jgi:hypothetical protein
MSRITRALGAPNSPGARLPMQGPPGSTCNGPRSILQLVGDDSTSLPRMEREEGKSERSYKIPAILYLDLLGLCVDIEQDRSPPNLESWPGVCRGLYGPSPLHDQSQAR